MHTSRLWHAVKWTSVVFTSISTVSVFYGALVTEETNIPVVSSELVAYLGTACAILLIDFLFVSLVNFLEMPLEEDESPLARLPFAIGLVVLYLFILTIGLTDLGWLAIAPRIGLGILVLISEMRQFVYMAEWRDRTWEARHQKNRDRNRKREEFQQIKQERKIKREARNQAINQIKPDLVKEYIRSYYDQYISDHPAVVRPDSGTLLDGELQTGVYPARAGGHIVVFPDGKLWDKTYDTERGAKIALGRAKNNGTS